LAAPTSSSSNGTRPGNREAVFSLILGLLSVLAIPIAIVVTDQHEDLRLLYAGVAVPVAFVLGVVGIRLAKRARMRLERTLGRAGGVVPARLGRVFSWIGVYFALIGAISLGVYAIEYYELLS
jgi:hypothetical protein